MLHGLPQHAFHCIADCSTVDQRHCLVPVHTIAVSLLLASLCRSCYCVVLLCWLLYVRSISAPHHASMQRGALPATRHDSTQTTQQRQQPARDQHPSVERADMHTRCCFLLLLPIASLSVASHHASPHGRQHREIELLRSSSTSPCITSHYLQKTFTALILHFVPSSPVLPAPTRVVFESRCL